jgi:hypothetical protein
MRIVGGVGIACAVALAGIGAALAQDITWKTISLDGGLTIDVPEVVADHYKPDAAAPKDVLMYFLVSAGDRGSMSCQLRRQPYAADSPRETLASGLALGKAGEFCKIEGPTIQDWQLGSSDASTTDGVQAGTCLSAYNDSSQQAQGKVVTMKVVAGKKNIYQFLCISEFDDKDGAVTAYATRWSDVVTRVQGSLHLPAEEKSP